MRLAVLLLAGPLFNAGTLFGQLVRKKCSILASYPISLSQLQRTTDEQTGETLMFSIKS